MSHLEETFPKVKEAMAKAQTRYKRSFDKRVKHSKHVPKQGDWVFVHSHAPTGGKLILKFQGPYQVLRADGRRFTIESEDGIRTVNGNDVVQAPGPPTCDSAWARALDAWKTPILPSSSDGRREPGFDMFVAHGWEEATKRLMLRVRWFGNGPKGDTWEYVEDLPAENVRAYCARRDLDPAAPQPDDLT